MTLRSKGRPLSINRELWDFRMVLEKWNVDFVNVTWRESWLDDSGEIDEGEWEERGEVQWKMSKGVLPGALWDLVGAEG